MSSSSSHLEASGPQRSASGNPHDGPDRIARTAALMAQVIVWGADHGPAEGPIALPAVTDLVGKVGVAERMGAAADDEQQVVGRRLPGGPHSAVIAKATSVEQRGADPLGRLSRHRRGDVAVEVRDQRRVGVAEALGRDLGRPAVGEALV
jgi:hypothetical protein